jgi:hypothetical protein
MKLKNLLIINLILILFFSGCNAKQPDSVEPENSDILAAAVTDESITESLEIDIDNGGYKDGFIFVYNEKTIYLGEYAENILTQLGSAIDFYEYREGCAADVTSVVKKYTYEKFDITTYVKDENDRERIQAVNFYENGICTPESLYIGNTFEDMISIYGTDYQEQLGFAKIYSYSKEGTVLSFGIKNEMIIDILYEVADIEDLYK